MLIERAPARGEIWRANLGGEHDPHWIVILSLNARNRHADNVLAVPFGSSAPASSTVIPLDPGETGLPGRSYLKAHYITTVEKRNLIDRHPRVLSSHRMSQLVWAVLRAIDPNAEFEKQS